MEYIQKYFPTITPLQIEQFSKLKDLYQFWNEQINVISRKDMDNFYERHVLHSLAIAKIMSFKDGSDVMDIGTGGGFPGIPLAILFPNCQFVLVDSIGKKVKVANEVAKELGLTNVTTLHERAENINQKFDFIVSRAVTAMPDFIRWTKNKFKPKGINDLANGVLYLKGGDLTEEMSKVNKFYKVFAISDFYSEEFFETKKVVYVRN
ncbi:MAG: 16S rRNA (guanine(527)-N(7))-methyltransferase RsmG [Crocinitomicaceae bacterium]|nr:16S rRNA (guanine(527)-N(7))-methyltransferase RsmG [Crocinitomicaceae bacterium]